ncbi:MAG: S8 family serine peptidase [Oscillospiraceae bacterium]|nr:S8 family serine peptidase [Oscillospiraceae bacterium]
MNKKILSLILAAVMVFGLVPANTLAVQSGITSAPTENGSLIAAAPAESLSLTGPMTLGSASAPAEATQTGIADSALVQAVTEGELTKFESQGNTPFTKTEEYEQYAADEKVTFIVVTEDAPLLKKFSAGDIAAQTASVNAHNATQETTLNAVKNSAKRILGSDMKLGYTYTIGTTGFSVETSYANKAKLEALPGVKSVYVAPTFALPKDMGEQELSPMTGNSSTMIGADVLNASGFTGKGMRIAILDTGILESHPSFLAMDESRLADPMTREGVEEIWDTLNASQRTNLLNTSYKSNKIPFAFNYERGDFDVNNTFAGSDHGTHVAGIVAANPTEGSTVIGMAPDAQLIVMQVFQSGGGANWATIMAALEDCIRLDVDAANLSLGAAAGFTDPAGDMLDTMNLFLESEVQVIIASGNDTNNAFMNLWGGDMSLILNPDIGLTGTPATYSSALNVASANNNGEVMLYFTVDGVDYGFSDTATDPETIFINKFMGQTLEYVMVPGIGAEEDYEGIDVTGKIAVISRGTTSFPEKQALAQEKGAIGCVIYNNTSGMFLMQINDGNGAIPCVSVSQAAGQAMAAAETKTLTVCNADSKVFKVDTTMSSFSSWGVTPDLKLKPEITGVGGNIFSTRDPALAGSYYGYMSGTSMATPQVAGAMAVLLQYIEETYPELTGAEQRRVAANIMMSTASPVIHASGLEYSPRNQGAGLVDLVNATTAESYLSNPAATEGRPKVEFGDDDAKNGVYKFRFELTNMADTDRTFALSSSVLTETIVSDWFIGNAPYGLEAKVTFGTEAEESVLCYDFNDDGAITTADARIVLQFAAGTLLIAEDNAHYAYLDVNSDGTVDSADAKVITDYCAELSVSVDLTAKVTTPADQVTVPAGETVKLSGEIILTDADKAYLDQFPNGIYVEGYVYATEVGVDTENAAAARLTMPMVGYYGDWSAPELFDRDDLGSYSLYPTLLLANFSDIGFNPYFRNGRSGEGYNYLSYSNPLFEMDFGQLRNAKKMLFTVVDNETGELYHTLDGINLIKTHFNTSYGMIVPTFLQAAYGELWDGKTLDGKELPDGTSVTYKVEAWLDDGDDIKDDEISFQLTLDNTAPVILNADSLQESLVFEGERTYLTLEILENEQLAAVVFMNNDGRVMGKYELENVPGETLTHTFDITGFGNSFSIIAADYAVNETEVDAFLNLGEQNNAKPEPQELNKDRLYGCETFDGALLEAGWFSANKADFSDPRNETYDSANRYYAAEYVNGYLIAQNANTGHLELVIPGGTYWSSQILTQNQGTMGEYGVWVLYDMALDHSGTLAESYGVNNETDATDGLFAVGWLYQGDQDNDGHDDGYNALFHIKFTNYGTVNVNPIARITGQGKATDLLTLGITTEGDVYGISTAGILYSVGKTIEYDNEVGADVVRLTEIGTTDFVNHPNYGGTNVIQSMGYDHNTDTMYWYAHTQVPNGLYYDNYNVTYSVDLATAKCTEVGTYGPGGQTALFVPNDLESDLFTLGVQATGMSLSPESLILVEGQTKRLTVNWQPWNAQPVDVTWSSSDETIATVDEYGFVTALTGGTVEISASAEIMLEGHWDVIDGNWIWVDPAMGIKTVTAQVNIVAAQEGLYGFAAADFKNPANNSSWLTYATDDLHSVTNLRKIQMGGQDVFWSGGAYYNGYVYTTLSAAREENNTIYRGTELYRSKVTEGATPAETIIGEPELIGFAENLEITALGFDYNTGRMYCVENMYVGGLGIVDLETGAVDMLGQPNGDLAAGSYIPGLCVTRDGTIVVSDAVANLYIFDPDTLNTRMIHQGNGSPYTAFYESMMYDYNTDVVYWNPCDGQGESPLCMVIMPESEWGWATVLDLGDVSSKQGTQQTVMFSIPENEPETQTIPVESISIVGEKAVTALQGSELPLSAVTVPTRPTITTKTWTSSDESILTVDHNGIVTCVSEGTATITVSITNKDEATYGGPFTDSVEITVVESAGDFVAFLNSDEGGTAYYDFWLHGKDYDLRNTLVGESMIAIYSLRAGTYYDGYFYAFNDKGQFMRINAEVPSDFKILGNANLDYSKYQVTAMAMDYVSGTMYGLTLPSDYSYDTWAAETHPGELVTINLDNGQLTTVAEMDFSTPVYALSCDANGTLYAAGGSHDIYSTTSTIYTVDKESGALTPFTTVNAGIHTGSTYYGNAQYNTQMTYDFGTNRLYLYATSDDNSLSRSFGMYMVDLDDAEPTASYLDGISLNLKSAGSTTKYGDVYLGLLAFIPEADEVPVAPVNGIILNKTSGRVAVGDTAQLTGTARPSNAADTSLTWSSSDESIATVDASGLVTGVAPGKVTITVTSNETGVTNQCAITVVELTGEQSVAYTVSRKSNSLIKFNPALPAQTAEVVASFEVSGAVKAMTAGDGCIYYITDEGYAYFLYRFDLLTQQSVPMGQLELFSVPSGLAYDPANNLIYATAGFYIFQFQIDKLNPNDFNRYTNQVMDSDYCTLTGITCVDGALYTIGNDYYTSAPKLMKYSDKYLDDRQVLVNDFGISLVDGATDFSYDASTELFYLTDAGHNIYTMDIAGNVESVDLLGNGIDIYGLAIFPAAAD